MSDFDSRRARFSESKSKSSSPRKQVESESGRRDRDRDRDHHDRPRKRRSRSPNERHSRRSRDVPDRRHRSRSRSPHRSRKRDSSSPAPRSRGPLPSQNAAFQKETNPDKQKANFGNSGRLAAASNTVQTAGQTIVLKYHEPAEARKPPGKEPWRLYIFKDEEILETVPLYEQSCWLFGREAAVVDILIEHQSCSKQHSVIQFRHIEKKNEFGDRIGRVRPYIIDLESANGTTVNDSSIPTAKYVELRDKDIIQFGHSSREYVIQLPPAG